MEFTKDQIMAKAPDLMKDMPEYYKNSDVAKKPIKCRILRGRAVNGHDPGRRRSIIY